MSKNNTPQDISIRYEKASIAYATQFLISPSQEEVLLDLASGLVTDESQNKILPIHTRLALPWSATERLAKILNQVVAKRQQLVQQEPQTSSTDDRMPVIPQASLPQMTDVPQTN